MTLRLATGAGTAGGSQLEAMTTRRGDGDFALGSDGIEQRRRAVVDLPWVWLHQVHGAGVEVVTHANADDVRGRQGDALVTAESDLVLSVQTADCVPLVLHDGGEVIAVVHAGWRGLVAGVVERTVDVMRSMGADDITMIVGPHIGGECYEFGEDDLAMVSSRVGSDVSGHTTSGRPALDLDVALDRIAAAHGILTLASTGSCTSCDATRWYSHRARGEAGRMATAAWRRSVGSMK